MILNQNISTIHVLCVGCTVQPARPFFSARRSQLQAGWIQPWWGDRREGAGGWLGGCCCSSCKVPFFHTGKGRSHPTTCLNMDKAVRLDAGPRWQTCSPDFCDRGAGAHWAHRSTVPLGLDFVLPYRRHDLGPISWCGGPAGSVSRQPLVWSRDQNSGHVTTHRAAGPHQTAPQSSLSHLHCSRLTTQKCATETSTLEKPAGGCCVHFQLQSGPKIATYSMLGPMPPCSWGWGAMWRMRIRRFSVLIRNTAIASPTLATSAPNRHAPVSQ